MGMIKGTQRQCARTLVLLVALLLVVPLSSTVAQSQAETAIADPFVNYYWHHQGPRILGAVNSPLTAVQTYPAQYFEKGRLEDHRFETTNPEWGLMYGRLTVELMEQAHWLPINNTPVTYGDLPHYASPKHDPPTGFPGGVMPVSDSFFIPTDPQLRPVPGYLVPGYFWEYITRADLFPGGWLHDVGLPLTSAFDVQVVKHDQQRTIKMQAFERTVLTYDPLNPPEWQIERANIGTDAIIAMGQTPLGLQPVPPVGNRRIEIDLNTQRLYAYEGRYRVFDFPVSTGRDGFETPPGNFAVTRKLLSHDMRGSAGGETWYVPDVPHVMYFLGGGYAIHGTYWHNTFGTGARLSHGCVNLPLDAAAQLYEWAPVGTPVLVY